MPDVTHLLPVYGLLVLGAATFAASGGVPLPASLLLLAAGALTADGTLGLPQVFLTVLVAALLGDAALYGAGRTLGRSLYARLRRRSGAGGAAGAPDHSPAEAAFHRWGGGAVWATRWLVTAPAPAVSFAAGASRYSFPRFVVLAAAGEVMWTALYLGLGRALGSNWAVAADYAGAVSVALLTLAGAGTAALLCARAVARTQGVTGAIRGA